MSKMRRKQLIIKLMRRGIKRQRKENKQLHDKHWSECRQISQYAEENRKLRLALLIASKSVSEQQEKPKRTYKEDFLEKFPNARRYYYGDPASCRKNIYGHGISNCPGYDGKDGRNCVGCWNEAMPDD